MNPRSLTSSVPAACLAAVFTILPLGGAPVPDAVVAADGSGSFKTVQEAIFQVPQTTTATSPWTILVKPGIYKERVHIQREKRFVRLVGTDPASTVVTYDLFASMKGPDGLEIGTFRTPTVWMDADDFTVENLTFDNSAGPVGQALALRVDGDRVSFRNCRFTGHQDTILLNRGRQYFRDCEIRGTVDFIFGGATAFFDRCTIRCVGDGYITAASTPQEAAHGFVFADCAIQMDRPGIRSYLGRPWRPYASTVFLRTSMAEGIRPEGWHNWNKPERETTTRYAEVDNTGPGAELSKRVSWLRKPTAGDVADLVPVKVLQGWLPAHAESPVKPPGRD